MPALVAPSASRGGSRRCSGFAGCSLAHDAPKASTSQARHNPLNRVCTRAIAILGLDVTPYQVRLTKPLDGVTSEKVVLHYLASRSVVNTFEISTSLTAS